MEKRRTYSNPDPHGFIQIHWLFTVLRPAQEFFTYMETSPLPVNTNMDSNDMWYTDVSWRDAGQVRIWVRPNYHWRSYCPWTRKFPENKFPFIFSLMVRLIQMVFGIEMCMYHGEMQVKFEYGCCPLSIKHGTKCSAWWKFKFIKMKVQVLFKEGIITKVQNRVGSFKYFLMNHSTIKAQIYTSASWYNAQSILFNSWFPGVMRGHNRVKHFYTCFNGENL
jgi:hypothetical protein